MHYVSDRLRVASPGSGTTPFFGKRSPVDNTKHKHAQVSILPRAEMMV